MCEIGFENFYIDDVVWFFVELCYYYGIFLGLSDRGGVEGGWGIGV